MLAYIPLHPIRAFRVRKAEKIYAFMMEEGICEIRIEATGDYSDFTVFFSDKEIDVAGASVPEPFPLRSLKSKSRIRRKLKKFFGMW